MSRPGTRELKSLPYLYIGVYGYKPSLDYLSIAASRRRLIFNNTTTTLPPSFLAMVQEGLLDASRITSIAWLSIGDSFIRVSLPFSRLFQVLQHHLALSVRSRSRYLWRKGLSSFSRSHLSGVLRLMILISF